MADGEEPDWETEPFATSSDLEQRWRAFGEMPSEDRKLADTLLSDASQIIRDECPRWRETSTLTRKIIACEMVKDVLSQSDASKRFPAYVLAPASAVAASLEDSGTPVVTADDASADDASADDAEAGSKAASRTKGK